MDRLKTVIIADLINGKNPLIEIDGDKNITDCLQTMKEHNILSLALSKQKSDKKLLYGVVDTFDIMCHIAVSTNVEKSTHTTEDFEQLAKLNQTKLSEIFGFSEENRFLHLYSPSDNVDKLLDHFCKGIHRGIVTSEPPKMISQFDVIKYIHSNLHLVPESVLQSSLSKLNITRSGLYKVINHTETIVDADVVSINVTDVTIHAIRKMVKEQLFAAPVVDLSAGGKIVSTISASDFRGLTADAIARLVYLPVGEFLHQIALLNSNQIAAPVCFEDSVTLETVLKSIVTNHIHRVWIVNAQGKPKGVVSLSDLIHFFWHDYASITGQKRKPE